MDQIAVEEAAFTERALDYETAVRYHARFIANLFRFEYWSEGILQYTKCRDREKNYHFIDPPGAKLCFWGLDDIPELEKNSDAVLIITEGEPDRIAVLQSQVENSYCLSVPNGAPNIGNARPETIAQDTAFSYLWDEDEKLIRKVDQFNRIILLTDDDDPGRRLRTELAMRLGESRCWFVGPMPKPDPSKVWPKPEMKDANDVLQNYGEAAVRKMVVNARPMRPGALLRPSDLPEHHFTPVYETGWEWLDPHLKFIRPELVVVTGVPSHGKGTFVRSLCCNMSRKNALRWAFLAPEDPAHRIYRDLKRFALNQTPHPNDDDHAAAKAWMDEHFRISLPPEDEAIDMEFVEAEMRSAAMIHNCQGFVIDPWNEISHDYGRQNITVYIEQTLVRLKQLARRYGLILIIVPHPKKIDHKGPPCLYDISDAAHWRNKADHGIIVFRAGRYGLPVVGDNGKEIAGSGKFLGLSNVTKIIIEKSKDVETMGEPGEQRARFIKDKFDFKHEPERKAA